MFSKNLLCENYPIASVYLKYLYFYIRNGNLKNINKKGTFRNFLKSKFDPNIHQKRTKLHHFKNISRGGMPPKPS